MMTYEVAHKRGGEIRHFDMAGELSADEAMRRLGVKDGPWIVRRYPKGRPDQSTTVQA